MTGLEGMIAKLDQKFSFMTIALTLMIHSGSRVEKETFEDIINLRLISASMPKGI